MKKALILVLKFYKILISPVIVSLVGGSCRYQPTCSEYAIEAVSRHGALAGTKLSIQRILRCHPLSHSVNIYDPVPQK